MKFHPFLYLCILVILITLFNVVYITKSTKRIPTLKLEQERRLTDVTLLTQDENTILSKIRYPDLPGSVLYGHLKFPNSRVKPYKLVLGIASVARPPGVDYLTKTLNNLIDVLALEEDGGANVVVVVGLFDKDKKTRQDRAKILYRKFRSSIDSGIISIVGPSSNIYPANNFYLMTRRPFNNTIERMEWQAKLSLDFAFLFSFSSSLGNYFMNLEDDVMPVQHFVRETFKYVQQRDDNRDDWSSLQFSNYLSIGRFYRCSDLHRLVELILLSYTRQPVDFIMHHFDVLQMADQFREFRRTPPLIEHIGAKSTIDVESIRARITRKYETFKKANPPARLSTNMTQWEDFQLEATYKPGVGHFFWARKIKPGDVVDVHFKKSLNVKALLIVTGFDKDEERSGNDRLLKGDLLEAKDKGCKIWSKVESTIDPWGKLVSNDSIKLSHTRCLRLQVWKATSDWLLIRLIRVMLYTV